MPTPSRLGAHVNHVSHIDVNVADLERSRRFYEATMPLEVVAHVESEGAFPSLGIRQGRFEGYVLRSSTQLGDYPALRLVEWKSPRPVGTPYLSHANVGWYRIVNTVRDIDRAREQVIAHGGEPFTETSSGLLHMYGPTVRPNPYRTFHAHDPDGITVQWSYDWPREDQTRSARDTGPEAARWLPERPLQDRLFSLVGGTTDVDRYAPFYTDVLGFDLTAALQTPEPVANIYGPAGGLTACDGGFFAPRGDRRFVIDWLRWFESSRHAEPYAEAHHLGIIRCAIEVDDLDAAYAALRAAAAQRPDLVGVVHPPETWDLGSEVGAQHVVNFSDGEGVMFQLVAAPPYPLGTLHPWGAETIDFTADDVTSACHR